MLKNILKADVSAEDSIQRNIRLHDRIAVKYEKIHGEIFNDIEQGRLSDALADAKSHIRTKNDKLEALDFGCGSGNLTQHLLGLGFHVTAADLSVGFLQLVRSKFPGDNLKTLLLENGDTSQIDDSSYDFVATYSVLHHIPDYLAACDELARITKPGGVIMIDHEASETVWQGDPVYQEFKKSASRIDWQKFFEPMNYVHKVRRLFNSRHTNEGDIHVWPDDHIEWGKVTELFEAQGFNVVMDEDFLLYNSLYKKDVYDQYVGKCVDTKCMAFRKN